MLAKKPSRKNPKIFHKLRVAEHFDKRSLIQHPHVAARRIAVTEAAAAASAAAAAGLSTWSPTKSDGRRPPDRVRERIAVQHLPADIYPQRLAYACSCAWRIRVCLFTFLYHNRTRLFTAPSRCGKKTYQNSNPKTLLSFIYATFNRCKQSLNANFNYVQEASTYLFTENCIFTQS